jgi:hypothetical protein
MLEPFVRVGDYIENIHAPRQGPRPLEIPQHCDHGPLRNGLERWIRATAKNQTQAEFQGFPNRTWMCKVIKKRKSQK